MRGWKRHAGALFAVLALVALVTAASAAEVTRDSYREAVEPICKVNVQANERILKGVKAKVKAGKLTAAAKQFTKAADSTHKAILKLKSVPQPPADEARLAKWISYIEQEERYFRQIAKKLDAGQRNGATEIQIRLRHTANQANNEVIVFEFRYCRVESSKFS